jgi:CHAT domain
MLDVALSITVCYNRFGELTLTYEPGDSSSTITVNTGIRSFQLSPLWRRLRMEIRQFKKSLDMGLSPGGAEIHDWKVIDDAIHKLREACLSLEGRLLLNRVKQIRDLFEFACPHWDDPQCEPKCVSLRARCIDDFVPIEFLPVFWTAPSRSISDTYGLEKACRGFLGFSAVVSRELLISKPPYDPWLQNSHRLPIKFFGNKAIEGAVREYTFFRKNQAHIEVDGPWQYGDRGESTDAFVRNTTSNLWSHTSYCDGTSRQPADQIVHFSCHCATSDDDPHEHLFELTCGGERFHKVKIRDLENRLTEIEEKQSNLEPSPARPLVFFNACGSSANDPAGVTSLPKLFLDRFRNRGFIGTETEIPDAVAEAFSRQFYAALLDKLPLGLAFHRAKRTILVRYRNPMGILYTMYADPDLQVRRKAKVLH